MALVPPHTHPRHEHAQYLTLADASAAGLFVPIAGGTMTGPLIIDAGPGALRLSAGAADHAYMTFYADTQAPGTRSGYFGYGSAGTNQFSLYNEMANGSIVLGTNGTGRVSVSADPVGALDVVTKQYADTKAAAGHTHSYLPLTGGELTGKLTISTPQGLVLHSPGVSVCAIASFNYSGVYGVRILRDWQGDSGALAPLQIAAPIDGNSAITVDWVRGDRAAASHGTHVAAATTAVVTTDGAGNVSFYYGGGTPVCSNGDWGAMQRAPHIGSWASYSYILVQNLNASAICRLNVLGA